MLVHTHKGLYDEHCEAEVVHRSLAGAVEEDAGVGGQRPVVVLARTVDACKGLFVEQAAESVLAGNTLHERHEEHVVVDGKVCLLEYRGYLKLVRGYLVVACLAWDAKLKGCYLKLTHELCDTLGDDAEVVVFHLLVLCRVMAHQRAACHHEVRTCCVEFLINEEVLLLPAKV